MTRQLRTRRWRRRISRRRMFQRRMFQSSRIRRIMMIADGKRRRGFRRHSTSLDPHTRLTAFAAGPPSPSGRGNERGAIQPDLPLLGEIADGVFEDGEAVAAVVLLTGPAGMVRRVDMAFRMRHKAEDTARFVAEAGDVEMGTVGVVGVGER